MRLLKFLITWSLRLPWRFTVPLVLLLLCWFAFVVHLLGVVPISRIANAVAPLIGVPTRESVPLPGMLSFVIEAVEILFEAALVVCIFLIGLVLSYNIAALVYRVSRPRPTALPCVPAEPEAATSTMLQQFMRRCGIEELRIGIICAGGGAKGAYQAGALKAIYEFLEENNALDRVRAIAGTSIGSWNAMFWLAGLVKAPGAGEPSAQEAWWRGIRIDRIIEFANYIPLARNYIVESRPWQELFDEIFIKPDPVRERLAKLFYEPVSPMHFYFTRSNVELGRLEFATNNTALPAMTRLKWRSHDPNDTEPVFPCDRYEIIEAKEKIDPFDRLKKAVFSSMDLPPLFPYMRIRTDREEWFEDGGVVDNLPMRFGTEVERCNLLFVLPLNASFEEPATHTSLFRRLFRVMDIRQGVLERNSMKLARLYNEKWGLLKQLPAGASGSRENIPDRVSVFAICPQQPLVIGTTEFWKPKEAGEAFDLMYSVTKCELKENLLESADPEVLRMTLVSPQGGTTYVDDF